MGNKIDSQNVLSRAYKDTERCIGFLWYQGVVAMTTLISGITGALLYPDNATTLTQAKIGTLAAFIGFLAVLGLTFLIASVLAPYRQRNEARKQLTELIPPKVLGIFFDPNDPNCVKRHDDYDKQIFFTSIRVGIKSIGITNTCKAKVSLAKCSRQDFAGNTTLLDTRPDILNPICIHENGNFELVPDVSKYVEVLEFLNEPDEDRIYITYIHQIEYETHSLPLNANIKYLIELVLSSENMAQAKYILSVTKGEKRQLVVQGNDINYAATNLGVSNEYF